MKFHFFFLCILLQVTLYAQEFKFAHVSDTHIGNHTAAEDLVRTVKSINGDTSISFVILSGDITEFGSDEELALAKKILDSLNKPWYIIPGNHDANWSESGSNSFKKTFGAEHFSFVHRNYLFIGTASGPNMRMSPGQIPREHIVWLDSTLKNLKDPSIPIIYINHYPQDTSLNNWYEAIDRLKQKNIQLILCGHGHANRKFNFEGIPAIMGRSNLRAKDSVGAYNIVTIKNGLATYEKTNPITGEKNKWAEIPLFDHDFKKDTTKYYRPSYAINKEYPNVKLKWSYQDDSDIGSGVAGKDGLLIATNTTGEIYALNSKTGKLVWQYKTGGKIYATPAVEGDKVVVASTDNTIYCLSLKTGKPFWSFKTAKPIVANALIKNKTAFIGSGDGHFRAVDINTGSLKWEYDSLKGFVVARPFFYQNKIFFGAWGTELYALDASTGKLAWKWSNGSSNRMFSPAACYPVAAHGKLFIVAPDRYMTAFDAETGTVIWRKQDPSNRVRESMGLSVDSSLVYAKTMDGFVIGVSTSASEMQINWKSDTQLGYELAPTPIVEKEGVIFVPSDSGLVTAVNRANGQILWKHKISNSLITCLLPLKSKEVVATTMDGKIICLGY